jgi:hypothetical protein
MSTLRLLLPVLALAGGLGCIRPSDDYDVHLHGAGTRLDGLMPAPTPMGGRLELVRYRLWGSNLGLGLTQLFGDSPRSDGLSFVTANGELGYPPDTIFDRSSAFVNAGPPLIDRDDPCFTRAYASDFVGIAEYVDIGDRIDLTTDDTTLRLARDPSSYPDPAGESFYVGYGQTLRAAITGSATHPDTWKPATTWQISAPGTLPPATATVGSVPFPWEGATLTTPPALVGLHVDGTIVRPPRHGYDASGVFVGDDVEDPVRFPGPWDRDVEITWQPSDPPSPVTLTLRLLSNAVEGSCGCAEDCAAGFTCAPDGTCVSVEGVTGRPTGELTCTLHDDGAFTLTPDLVADLRRWVAPDLQDGAILLVSRLTEGEAALPDVRTFNDKRIPMAPVRTRAIDTVVTRLEAP